MPWLRAQANAFFGIVLRVLLPPRTLILASRPAGCVRHVDDEALLRALLQTNSATQPPFTSQFRALIGCLRSCPESHVDITAQNQDFHFCFVQSTTLHTYSRIEKSIWVKGRSHVFCIPHKVKMLKEKGQIYGIKQS
ncbi:hypothetical protein EDB81DRAFT_231763 [Dactylonectria macrodidyma]|uniref:Secreted protein n=1 Tax=Dactylonectria macrodidyma TaxID=307937 RepID=A0A9P9IH58_9HYPO|nr:hypothetical protein EDB81DRAFT_231763 [Dactylonectria macrodidyma]